MKWKPSHPPAGAPSPDLIVHQLTCRVGVNTPTSDDTLDFSDLQTPVNATNSLFAAGTKALPIWSLSLQDAENQPLTSTANETPKKLEQSASAPWTRNPVFFNDRGLRAGWRLLIWLFTCVAFAYALQNIYVPLRRHVPHHLVAQFGQLLFVIALLGGNMVMAKLERRSSLSYGFADQRWAPHFFFGVLIGWLSLTLMLGGMDIAHHFAFGAQYMHGPALAMAAVINALSFLFAVALFEELLFRSYALYTLADGIGFWPASILLSLLFAAAHISNSGEAKVGIIAVAFFGMMLCFSVWRTGSLLWAIGFHFMWDYSESFLYGVPDSGMVSPEHLLSAKFAGPAWITGGTVGPEGSWFIFLVLAAITLVIHFTYPKPRVGTAMLQARLNAKVANTEEMSDKLSL
ncbi:MAG TPA: type II CAAX endopeptidase family protein [Terriglobales bacterium]|nr:type II CAAX endopeptidase family protein [Terriglobales bacterium]